MAIHYPVPTGSQRLADKEKNCSSLVLSFRPKQLALSRKTFTTGNVHEGNVARNLIDLKIAGNIDIKSVISSLDQ